MGSAVASNVATSRLGGCRCLRWTCIFCSMLAECGCPSLPWPQGRAVACKGRYGHWRTCSNETVLETGHPCQQHTRLEMNQPRALCTSGSCGSQVLVAMQPAHEAPLSSDNAISNYPTNARSGTEKRRRKIPEAGVPYDAPSPPFCGQGSLTITRACSRSFCLLLASCTVRLPLAKVLHRSATPRLKLGLDSYTCFKLQAPTGVE